MAKQKYFHITNVKTQEEHLVAAPREGLALSVISGSAKMVRPASDEEIADFFAAGGQKHDKSSTDENAKLFLIHVEPKVLIAAKNAGEAFALVNEGAYTAVVATQHTLVKLLERGVKPVYYVEPERQGKGAAAPEGNADAGATARDDAEGSIADGHIAGDAPDAGAASNGASDDVAGAETVAVADSGAAEDLGGEAASNDADQAAAA